MTRDNSRDLVLLLGEFNEIKEAVDLTKHAEELGYGYVTTGETSGRNVVSVLSIIAHETSEIGITNDVFSPYSRSPALLGQTAVTMQEISDGRARIRLGASSPALVERWHGLEFDRPLRRVREAIEIIRQVQSGDPVEYDGEIFTPDGLRLTSSPPEPTVPVDVATLGPKATEMAGRFADGWVPQLLPLSGLEDRMEDLRRGADLGDRDLDDLRVSPTVRCCALEDGDQAREYARRNVTFMIAVYGPYYRQAIGDAGWSDITDEVRSRWRDGDREGATAAVSDELLDELVAAGTPEKAREQVERFEALDGVDTIQVSFFNNMSIKEMERTVKELAPEP
jgi:coenzyme F420-dependent oxidoreductase